MVPAMVPLALLASAPAPAAPVAPSAAPPAQAALMRPLTLTKLNDMDFGYLGVIANGTAVINPVTDTMTTTGGVLRLGGTPRAAAFRGVAQGNSVVIIRIPNGGINLTRAGGTETILLNAFTLDGQSKRAMARAGVFDFKVGATLRPTAGQVEGLYTGTFEVTVQYP
ncbi:MAG TPA: DUF4402 domain-containing protein [Sphingomicrobium sp.]|nr:DUF4402 domain-containing protein [Sphingomicrobium sp.]